MTIITPAAVPPMLATTRPFPRLDAASWAVEMKWDGVRALASITGSDAALWARSGRNVTAAYPELGGLAHATEGRQALLDGEIVALVDGQPDFEALQSRMHVTSQRQARELAWEMPVTYLAFDLLMLDGAALDEKPYAHRRELLGSLLASSPRFLCPPSFPGTDFDAVLAASRASGLEGVMVKHLRSRYEPGVRSYNWIKVKNIRRQEVVVGGWQAGQGNRAGKIGSLLIGTYDGDQLQYGGHVGVGLSESALKMLAYRLEPLRQAASPFAGPVPWRPQPVTWVKPRVVIEVAFTLWTRAGQMRFPVYKGLRNDKDPRDVVREAVLAVPGQLWGITVPMG